MAIEFALLFVRSVTYISNLKKTGQKLQSLSRAIGTCSDRRTIQAILYLWNAMNCIGQTIISATLNSWKIFTSCNKPLKLFWNNF